MMKMIAKQGKVVLVGLGGAPRDTVPPTHQPSAVWCSGV